MWLSEFVKLYRVPWEGMWRHWQQPTGVYCRAQIRLSRGAGVELSEEPWGDWERSRDCSVWTLANCSWQGNTQHNVVLGSSLTGLHSVVVVTVFINTQRCTRVITDRSTLSCSSHSVYNTQRCTRVITDTSRLSCSSHSVYKYTTLYSGHHRHI